MFILTLLSISTLLYAGQKKILHSTRLQRLSTAVSTVQQPPRSSVRLLVALVEFQKDSDSQTTGDGTFMMETNVQKMIDPPPHDTTYFRNKIKFVTNYFQKVSKGRVTISGDIVSDITLTKKMEEYSPPTNSTDNKKLAQLAIETWQAVCNLNPKLDFSQYDAFVIFHAGCGRDVDLVSVLGYNPTPYDIPSLYLDSTAFAKALDTSSFQGIVLHGGATIKNTMILPETETHIVSTGLGNDTLELSMNGLFAASIGSFLGLPDLFDTQTGASGIGQYGLMDGAGFFAYNGVFPPEPSAWEKIFLGWTAPISVSTNATNLPVPAVSSFRTGQDTIYKIPITSSEYFLVENRSRDLAHGLHITSVMNDGTTTMYSFAEDTNGFNYSDIYNLWGSVTDVSNYDWALIGYHDDTTTTNQKDGGGILIWHIDEN
ncbi:MAG TPA: immune inhibitor A domain-containing protein, partial [Bacteroidota bacterium]|nr:immune inhibitor A domain-containing protein [Bacteroidota bacterium]